MSTDKHSYDVLGLKIINKYKAVAIKMLKMSFPTIHQSKLEDAVDYSIIKRMKNGVAYIDNNYKNKQIDSSILEISEYLMKSEPIITSAGVLFKSHAEMPLNPITKMLQKFLSGRKIFKNEMFKYPKGSELYERYNLLQLLAKLDANGFYGFLSNSSSLFFNLYIATATTAQGQSSISTAAMCFESILANNVKFRSLNEVINFIDKVTGETRVFNDSIVLDCDIDMYSCFEQLIETCGHGYTPDETDLDIIWNVFIQLTTEDRNRLFYKNNLFAFMNNRSMTKAIVNLLVGLNSPFLDPNEAPEEIKVELDALWDILREYVFYNHSIIDRIDRLRHLPRKVTLTIDTDSNFVCLDPWYKFVLEKVIDIPMQIKKTSVNIQEYMDRDEEGNIVKDPIHYGQMVMDYDFYTDEVIEIQRMVNPVFIIPQDGLRYSIINIIAYCLSKMINEAMINYTKDMNSWSPDKKCYLSMKNEFLFKRVMLTDAKKNYAGIMELEEGHKINNKIQIKGLSLKKSTLNTKSQDQLQAILYEEILMAPEISQTKILKRLVIMEKGIYNSLSNGSKEYYKPLNIKSISSYDNPMGISGIKAAYVWNELHEDGLPSYDLSTRNAIEIVKLDINAKNIINISKTHPDIYAKCLLLMQNNKVFNKGITAIAIPSEITAPEWVREFINYKEIVNDVLNNFSTPLESIGLMMTNKTSINYTNILQL